MKIEGYRLLYFIEFVWLIELIEHNVLFLIKNAETFIILLLFDKTARFQMKVQSNNYLLRRRRGWSVDSQVQKAKLMPTTAGWRGPNDT